MSKGLSCILARFANTKGAGWAGANTLVRAWLLELSTLRKRGWPDQGSRLMGSSDEVHVMDALAITGDEGRGSLRKAAGSWQTSIDPQMSEWGNPAREGHSALNT